VNKKERAALWTEKHAEEMEIKAKSGLLLGGIKIKDKK
jgi:hypothetical protein